MPVVVRVVLPLAAGAMLAPLPAWSAGPTGMFRDSVPIRVVLSQTAVREEGLIEGEIGHAGTDSETGISKTFKAGTRISFHPDGAASMPSRGGAGATLNRFFILPRGAPDRCVAGLQVSHSPRAPPV